VNGDTGHLAAQILFRATLKMDQDVKLFPFDCQWLAITMSLREEVDRNRSFLYQYCEVDSCLQLDEWQIHEKPAFSTLTKHDAPSIQDTVVCGILVQRNSRYYAVNIIMMLGIISTLVFTIYTLPTWQFWERAEVFLGIFPLIVIFKLSAQGKLPRVGYSTQFDRYALSCTALFFVVVICAFIIPCLVILPELLCEKGIDIRRAELVEQVESSFFGLVWVSWNVYFAWIAWRAKRLTPLDALGTKLRPQLQDSASLDPQMEGLAPRLSALAKYERDLAPAAPTGSESLSSWVSRRTSIIMLGVTSNRHSVCSNDSSAPLDGVPSQTLRKPEFFSSLRRMSRIGIS